MAGRGGCLLPRADGNEQQGGKSEDDCNAAHVALLSSMAGIVFLCPVAVNAFLSLSRPARPPFSPLGRAEALCRDNPAPNASVSGCRSPPETLRDAHRRRPGRGTRSDTKPRSGIQRIRLLEKTVPRLVRQCYSQYPVPIFLLCRSLKHSILTLLPCLGAVERFPHGVCVWPSFPYLDLAIAICFIYLLMALVCSTVNETIAGIINSRGKTLEKGILYMLHDPDLKAKFYANPLIQGAQDVNRPVAFLHRVQQVRTRHDGYPDWARRAGQRSPSAT